MKKIVICLGLILPFLLTPPASPAQNKAVRNKPALKLFYVYSEKDVKNFFVPSGWLGDYADLTLDLGWTDNPYDGETCIKITYHKRASSGQRWAGMYWQNPENNWGTEREAGVNLTGIKKLTFWVRGEQGGEVIKGFMVGGISGPYPDTTAVALGPVILTPEWKQYTIPLEGKNLSHIIGGFAWSTSLDVNPQGCTFYLDEIRYE